MQQDNFMARTAQFIRRCATSRLGWLLAAIHAVWFYFGVVSMGPPSRAAASFLENMAEADWTLFAGRPFHFAYQSWVLKLLVLADMPAMLAASIGNLPFWPLWRATHVGIYEGSYISASVAFLLASVQWLTVGNLTENWIRGRQRRTGGTS